MQYTDLMSTREAAAALDVAVPTLRSWAHKGRVKAYRLPADTLGRRVLVYSEEEIRRVRRATAAGLQERARALLKAG